MLIHLLLVLIFLLNIVVFWQFVYGAKFKPYKYVGAALFFLIPFVSVVFPQPKFELDYFWWIVAGLFLFAAGIVGLIWAGREFKDISPLDPPGEALISGGPYGWIRHPQYLSAIFIMVGWWWIFAAVYSFYFGMFILAAIWLNAYFEEKLLVNKFGKKYLEYRSATGMFWVK
ncbi:hypothetical protein A3K48_01880 [candidate division WOR-1 bacterium RIFOXYA12_FULL_52_29]|uniref:Steroid 5-alpha reductase C-terminal domain-containing protein n=1 Tax=candidate division WOR-1 bacterium RIFOXYC12_FULL_54_18 TaxID=1802584 RepID=A0A1F4T5H5_UNCSA|nr:MAG: hypothetical protein A3K44_01880 [candidate division WOR-1 bacterium RIFOXYA2_FULL_51_19]OGC17332.1 MAG: hypothetical protein A3K48_01880 [candidate division WOR-1 bacterium RIFOXYA12_FULL_52_29]OGC26192.1 MAG: hypothetical protein A3K32_01875 [candidate division WOR-1 bacterium RIFOXYB2_FULL_45_9]OGC27749.1 MAG: hypothetical protein A3K49_01880 [candidate division WOR-1 bacterium RIFOXYC12_FULL_54_18]OGC29960.1 MAG: hypothetical protein A2346_04455 [candidate division WOR-1 bacterium R